MSATAFQRMRREAAAKKAAQSQKEVEETLDIQLLKVKKENTDDKEEKTLKDMTVDELKEYAEKHNIDVGKSTSHNGILEKIKAAEKYK